LVTHKHQLGQARNVLDAASLELAQCIVDILEVLANVAERSIGADEGALSALGGHEVGVALRLGWEASELCHDTLIVVPSFSHRELGDGWRMHVCGDASCGKSVAGRFQGRLTTYALQT
jgi:hypothetical protein